MKSRHFLADLRKQSTVEAVALRATQLQNEYPEHAPEIAKAHLKVSSEKLLG